MNGGCWIKDPKTGEKVAGTRKAAPAKKTTKKSTRASASGRGGPAGTNKRPAARPQTGGSAKRSLPALVPPVHEEEPPMPKTHLSKEQLQSFKQMLLHKRAELLGDVRALTQDALGRSRQGGEANIVSTAVPRPTDDLFAVPVQIAAGSEPTGDGRR